MTYETVAELLADVQTYSLKRDQSCLVLRPNRFTNLSANSSFALIFLLMSACWARCKQLLHAHSHLLCPGPKQYPRGVGRHPAGRGQDDVHVKGKGKPHIARSISTACVSPCNTQRSSSILMLQFSFTQNSLSSKKFNDELGQQDKVMVVDVFGVHLGSFQKLLLSTTFAIFSGKCSMKGSQLQWSRSLHEPELTWPPFEAAGTFPLSHAWSKSVFYFNPMHLVRLRSLHHHCRNTFHYAFIFLHSF